MDSLQAESGERFLIWWHKAFISRQLGLCSRVLSAFSLFPVRILLQERVQRTLWQRITQTKYFAVGNDGEGGVHAAG